MEASRWFYGISLNSKTEIKGSISSSGVEMLLTLRTKSRPTKMPNNMALDNFTTNANRMATHVLFICTILIRQLERRLKKSRTKKGTNTYLGDLIIWSMPSLSPKTIHLEVTTAGFHSGWKKISPLAKRQEPPIKMSSKVDHWCRIGVQTASTPRCCHTKSL